jgi:hypothetical protein
VASRPEISLETRHDGNNGTLTGEFEQACFAPNQGRRVWPLIASDTSRFSIFGEQKLNARSFDRVPDRREVVRNRCPIATLEVPHSR